MKARNACALILLSAATAGCATGDPDYWKVKWLPDPCQTRQTGGAHAINAAHGIASGVAGILGSAWGGFADVPDCPPGR